MKYIRRCVVCSSMHSFSQNLLKLTKLHTICMYNTIDLKLYAFWSAYYFVHKAENCLKILISTFIDVE